MNQYADGPDQPVTRAFDMGRLLVAKGHDVTIFASSYHHYLHKELHLGRGEKWRAESIEGVRFVWLRTTPYRRNDWRRLINILGYSWRALLVGSRLPERPDVILGTCAHALAPLSAFLLSIRKGSRFIYEVADLWPQTLIDMGALSARGAAAWLMRVLEKFLFRKADTIISFLPGVKGYVAELGLPGTKVVWIPNGADLSRFRDIKAYTGGDSGHFTVMYLGGHARYHGLEVALQAAEILQNQGKENVRFVFVGDGAEKPKLMELAKRMRLQNVEFRGWVPKAQVAKVMGEADALLFCFKKMAVLKYGTSPIKIYDYLCSGRPLIYAHEASNSIVEEAQAGITVPPEDPGAMAQAILKLITLDPQERVRMGNNGLEYVKRNHDVRMLAERLEACLQASIP